MGHMARSDLFTETIAPKISENRIEMTEMSRFYRQKSHFDVEKQTKCIYAVQLLILA
jgi:hypothetical protein